MRRLLPEPAAELSLEQALGQLRPWESPHRDRPQVLTNFALTLDGHATIDGRSGAIGTEADTAMLVGLRTRVDAVMIGAGTMRAEGYGRVVGDPAKRELREGLGLAHDPLMVIVSNSLELPWDAPLFTEGHGRVVVFTGSAAEPPATTTTVEIERRPGGVDLSEALRDLRHDRGIRALLCEGGPRLHAQLIAGGLVDELFVTHAPKLAGGEGPGLVVGLPATRQRLETRWLLSEPASGEVFARYGVI